MLKARTSAEVLAAYFGMALLVLASGYFFPQQGDQVNSVPIALSIALLLPIYLWYKCHRATVDLTKQIRERKRGSVLFWTLTLFILALLVRVPSVLLFGAPYEKTPLILLTILVILFIDRTDLSAFGFTTEQFGKSLVYGLLLFLMLNTLAVMVFYGLAYAVTGQIAFQSYDLAPFVLTMPFMTLCVGISEEGLFRGYIQTHLSRSYSTAKAILAQAVLFGLWHFVWNLSPFDPLAMAQYVAVTFVIGLVFGYFYSKTGNLVPLVFAHGLWNSVPTGIRESPAVVGALNATPPITQILVAVLPYVVSISLTLTFAKFLVRRTNNC